MLCPSCGAESNGRFCSACGKALNDAACSRCDTPLTPGAKFCHRCGTPAGAAPIATRSAANAMPWAFGAIALVALIALLVGQRFGARPEPSLAPVQPADANVQAPAPGMPRAPDISSMTPLERAERLYDRIMRESESGNRESARTFVPMAIAAYEALGPLTLDQRYDLGRIGIVAGDTTLARAESDTILNAKPTHLLGLILAADAARAEKLDARADAFARRLLGAEAAERATGLPEYGQHANEIQQAVSKAKLR